MFTNCRLFTIYYVVSCFTCGLEEIDPEIDKPGSYGDERKEGTPPGRKMYNHTCDIADDLGLGDNWKRKCPPGTKSCFWAEGRYKKQSKYLNSEHSSEIGGLCLMK